ncbi:MAG: U32 family peptidase [Eubacterium sp.]|nr:U32 family peptidase [Eubacterium sp.]
MTDRIELLAPAGDPEKLRIAIEYGADAVYFGGEDFSLRSQSDNFTDDDIRECVEYAHERGRKCYLTLNIYAHNGDIEPMHSYLERIKDIDIDAFLVSDPGVLSLLKSVIPGAHIHLSTQANMTNHMAAEFWKNEGVERLVLARELSLEEIRDIHDKVDIELEAFVHGAMCISYSGRCLLSNFMSGRDANKGLCSHPCRWNYALMEEKRPGEYFPVEEDSRGTYFMNSHDLCMIEHIPDLIESGLSSLKIEGRMKSVYYVAATVRAYRLAIDAYYDDPEGCKPDSELLDEVGKASHRNFTTGFFYGDPGDSAQNYSSSNYIKDYSFTGKVISYDEETGLALVEQRNKMSEGETIEIFGPGRSGFSQILREMYDAESGERLESCPHAQQMIRIRMDQPVRENYLIRKKINKECD